MSGFLCFRRLNCILSFRDPNFFEHVHLEWTYSQVPSRVYYSQRVGLRLLVRLEKSLITKGPHRYVWSETRHVCVWTWWGGPREDSSKPRCFWRFLTLWQLWQKLTPTLCPGFWFLTHRDMFWTHKKNRVEIRFVSLPFRLSCLGSRLPTQEIEFLPRLPTQGPWVRRYNARHMIFFARSWTSDYCRDMFYSRVY